MFFFLLVTDFRTNFLQPQQIHLHYFNCFILLNNLSAHYKYKYYYYKDTQGQSFYVAPCILCDKCQCYTIYPYNRFNFARYQRRPPETSMFYFQRQSCI